MIFAIGFAWILTGQIIQLCLPLDKYTRITGVVSDAREHTVIERKRLIRTTKVKEIRIFLRDTAAYFSISASHKNKKFQPLINTGDTAIIYIRPQWLVPMAIGKRKHIQELHINGQPLFTLRDNRKITFGMMIISIITIPVFLFLGLWYKRKMKENNTIKR
jgi:hypothetical protein